MRGTNEGPGQRIRRKRKRECHRNFDQKKNNVIVLTNEKRREGPLTDKKP
jgi:hypothetical protein